MQVEVFFLWFLEGSDVFGVFRASGCTSPEMLASGTMMPSRMQASHRKHQQSGSRWSDVSAVGFGVVLGCLAFFAGCDGGSSSSTSTGSAPSESPAHASDQRRAVPDTSLKITGALAEYFALIQQDQLGAARVRLRRYLDAQPNEGLAHFLFGLTYHVEKRYGPALESFARARELAPTYGQTAYFQGWAMYYMGQPDEAEDALLWYIQGSPENADAQFALGLIAYEQGDLDTAANRLTESVNLFQQSERSRDAEVGKALVRLADVRMQQGQLEVAQQTLSDALTLIPESPELHYKMSQVLRRQGLVDQAQRAYDTYEELWRSKHPTTSFPE